MLNTDSGKEIEERTTSFFDDLEEEKILAEVAKRYNNNLQGAPPQNMQTDTKKESTGKDRHQNTEEFMREMGVVGTDTLNPPEAHAARGVGASSDLNKDLQSIQTQNLHFQKASNQSHLQSPGGFSKMAQFKGNQGHVDILKNLGSGIDEVGAYLAPSALDTIHQGGETLSQAKKPQNEQFSAASARAQYQPSQRSGLANIQHPLALTAHQSVDRAAEANSAMDHQHQLARAANSEDVIVGMHLKQSLPHFSGEGAIINTLTQGEAEEELEGEELSYYALADVVSVADIIQQQNLLQNPSGRPITSLRVMHCDMFSQLNGIQIQLFQNIVDLNLSSNCLEDISELIVLSKVRRLNLSCNRISQITGLDNCLHCLETLVLSHNRVSSLAYFKQIVSNGQVAPRLESIDLNDNYIGNLEQVQCLRTIGSLKDLVFSGKSLNNPICDFDSYQETVLQMLPQIQKLDGVSIYELGVKFGPVVGVKKPIQLSGSLSKQFPGHQGLHEYDGREVLGQIADSSEMQRKIQSSAFKDNVRTSLNLQADRDMVHQGIHKSKVFAYEQQLRLEIENLQNKLKEVEQQRDQTIQKHEEGEVMWEKKLKKLQADQKSLLEMNESLKDDNKELIMQVDKYIKQGREKDDQRDDQKDKYFRLEMELHDAKRENQNLQDQITDLKDEAMIQQKKTLELQVTSEQESQRLRDTQNQLRQCEEKCSQLYQDLMDTNNKGMERWQDIQKKYEEGQSVITRQLVAIDELNKKVSDLKDVNGQLEFTWTQKYQEDLQKKDREISRLKQDIIDTESKADVAHKQEIKQLKLQFRDDVLVIDKELNKQIQLKKQALAESEDWRQKSSELAMIAKAAAQSEEKKDAMMEEVKIAVQKERQQIGKEKEEVEKDKKQLQEYKKIKEEEVLAMKTDLDKKVFECKELDLKLSVLQEQYRKIEKRYQEMVGSSEDKARQMFELQSQLDKIKGDSTAYEEQLKRECEDARVELDDLSDLLKTKDRMLEDQNIVIANLKEKIKEKEDETKQVAESKTKQREFYEDKLQEEFEDTEKLRSRIEELQNQVTGLEEYTYQLKQDTAAAESKLQDKDQVIELVEQEVLKIKHTQDQEKAEAAQKEELIQSQQVQLDEWTKQLEVKDSEIKLLLERMEQYKQHKDAQITGLKEQLQKSQNDIKLLVSEHEKQRKKQADNVGLLKELLKRHEL